MEPLGFKKTDPENCPCNTKCDGFLLLDNSISSLMFSFEISLTPSLLYLPSRRAVACLPAHTLRPRQPLASPDAASATPAPIFVFHNVVPAHNATPISSLTAN
ncbi:hypothetical protein MRB53_014737 [Persea americana]|uniref:Uncharacterized protein n=1 Tax=Persea americana TaxID=3435 RepID=A0ACC2KBS6_PERAE|nr:hypothetical protein MRB53_014737 [Persea americana]